MPTRETQPPGTESPRRFRPKLRYELLGCGLHGHELLGTDARELRPQDAPFARDLDGLRWYRCLRCDSWLPLQPPAADAAGAEHPPDRDAVSLPLRGRPLRDRFVLRAIAVDRVVHVLVLAALAVAIFLFAEHRSGLHHLYARVLNDLQGGLGGPVNDSGSGVINEFNRLFSLTSTELNLAGLAVTAYTALLAIEAVGLWWAKRWAEYLTLIETGVLVPFEIYELTETVTALKLLTLVINLAVVAYLLVGHRLFGIRGGGKAAHAERERDSGWEAIDRATPRSGTDPSAQLGYAEPGVHAG
jgi:uncharacterized membrane protein (DUF2068 family)